jgi:hypothetical protein
MIERTSGIRKTPSRGFRVALSVLLCAVLTVSSLGAVDRLAEQKHQALFERALVTFALARALNGVISTVQGTELALQPAGVGVTLTPGQVLDPVNDLVERFSWIMLTATLSLGVQQVLLDMGQWWGTRLVLVFVGLMVLWFAWFEKTTGDNGRFALARWLPKLFLALLILRFAVPVALLVNEGIYALFLEPRYQESTQLIEQAGKEIEDAALPEQDRETGHESLIESLGRVADNARESIDFRARLAEVSKRASEMIEQLLQLAAVFVFQTILIPLLFLWLILRLLRRTF